MKSFTTLSPAKLNLFLHITGKRADGYHNLQTVFRLLNWGDEMRFDISKDEFFDYSETLATQEAQKTHKDKSSLALKTDTPPIRLHCDPSLTNNLMDNLIIKSAYALLNFSNPVGTLAVIDIYLDKKIPTGAGLGGGSSNAATTLMALNELWQLNLTAQELQNIGVTLGADVPIFIYAKECGSAIAEGIGEVFTPIKLPKQTFLLLTPSAHISTAELFAHPQLQRNITQLSTDYINSTQASFIHKLQPPFSNVFEPVVCELSHTVYQALAYLQQFEPITGSTARMTGSGSCVFLPLSDKVAKNNINQWLTHAPCPAYLVDGI